MAVYISCINSFSKNIFSRTFNSTTGSIRNASKKSGTSKVKKSPSTKPARFGVKVQENAHVNKGQLLIHQRFIFACPGLNVGVGRIADLYAKAPGRVVLSYDKADLRTDHFLVQIKYPDSLPRYKTYFNIIPDKQHQRFKLVEQIYIINFLQAKSSMATQMPPYHRTQGDGMEKVENESTTEQTIILQPREIVELDMKEQKVESKSHNKVEVKNIESAIKLTPQTVDKKKKNFLGNLKNKEPKFVPYEPYKAAVRPIVPPSKKAGSHKRVKHKEVPGIFCSGKERLSDEKKEKSKVLGENESSEVDWKTKLKALESEMQTMKEENEELEKQLKFQVQVNGELKNLLVAAVGEDMETKVHVLTEDKLHLAQALLKSSESLTSHQEQAEWLASQCEVWRSKFLASSVMVEELARWKASLCQKVNESHDALKKLMEDQKQIGEKVAKTHVNLCRLRDNFDLHNRKNKLSSWNVLDVCEENLKLTDTLMIELLGTNKFESDSKDKMLENWKKTPAEKSAEHVLANPNLLHLIKEPDAACNAVVGAAVTLSGQLYLESHPPKMECCPQCTGEIKLI